jgi:hypothetical protein
MGMIIGAAGPGKAAMQRPLKEKNTCHIWQTPIDAVAIEGEMEVDETGRRVTVCVPLSNADAIQLWKLLGNYKRDHDLPDPDPPTHP